jgi:HAD superfamily hydrolase (TIGR01549 family)
MTVQAVFFDMGGTLETYGWTPELRIQETVGIRQRLEDAGIVLGLNDEQLYEIIFRGFKNYNAWRLISLDELPPARVWSEYILNGCSFDGERLAAIAEDLMFFMETHYYQRSMRPEVPGVLEAIRELGLKIGLISNVTSRGQVPVNLREYGIYDYFNPIVLSSEYGRRKPDPAIFHYAARLANVPTSKCVYIGDRLARDILGARRAGFRFTVQILHDYDHGESDKGATPDAVILHMTDLVDLVRSEMGKDCSKSFPSGDADAPIRAFLFDAGDILYHRPQKYRRFAAFLKEQGITFNGIDREASRDVELQAYRGLITRDQYRDAILEMYGITQPALVEKGKLELNEDDNDVVFFDGVCETLHALKDKGYFLGIITDTAAPIHVKLDWFERGGFGNVWDSITSSVEVGVRKPDAGMYQAALRQLGIRPDQAVFVGHKTSELAGARAVGMQTVALNYEENAAADHFIERFSDLLQIPLAMKSVSI